MPLREADAKHARGERAAQALLALGQLGEQVHEDVGHRHAAEDREPDAAGDSADEPQRRCDHVDRGQHQRRGVRDVRAR